jgi:hypothetical protein
MHGEYTVLYFIAAAAENQTCTSKVGRGAPPPLPPLSGQVNHSVAGGDGRVVA